MEDTTENVQRNEYLIDKKMENDVLRLRIDIMTENHAAEQKKLIQEKDRKIDEMKIKHGDQADTIQQQDAKIELLKQQSTEISKKKEQLERELKDIMKKSTKANKAKDVTIRKLETELKVMDEKLKGLKEEIKSIKAGIDEKQNKQTQDLESVQTAMQKQTADMACIMHHTVDMKKQFGDLVSRFDSTFNTLKTAQKVNINEVHNVQIGNKGQITRTVLTASKRNLKFNK